LFRDELSRPPVLPDSGGHSTRRYSPRGPKTALNAVLAGVERKEIPIGAAGKAASLAGWKSPRPQLPGSEG
jgi:hypothetical protein